MAHLAAPAVTGELRSDIDEAEAAALFWLVTGFDAFDVLYTQRGLPPDAIADRRTAAAERTLCP
jgi:hypothetical protein